MDNNSKIISDMTERLIKRLENKGVKIEKSDKVYIVDYAKWIYKIAQTDTVNNMTNIISDKFIDIVRETKQEGYRLSGFENELIK